MIPVPDAGSRSPRANPLRALHRPYLPRNTGARFAAPAVNPASETVTDKAFDKPSRAAVRLAA